MSAMSSGDVELEPEVRDWYLSLGQENQARVQFNIDRLAEIGPLLDEQSRSSDVWPRDRGRRGMATETKRTTWADLTSTRPGTKAAEAAYADEARIADFRDLVYRLRTEAGLTQADLAERMGTTQSAIARIEGGGTRPSLDTLERLATAIGADLVVGVGENLSANRSIAKLEREGHAVVRRVS
jgi:ribosome-binding protein aMBF1 (putative translation factor)